MRICFVVDYRSPIARNWIAYFVDAGHDVHVVSTYPISEAGRGLSSFHCVPIGLSGLAANARLRGWAAVTESSAGVQKLKLQRLRQFGKQVGIVTSALQLQIAPLDAHRQKARVRQIVQKMRPDLVHAMRIPFEGILATAALADSNLPLLVSVWGNDFTLFASQYFQIARATRRAMQQTSALHADCHRDIRLAHKWGLPSNKPTVVLPSSGGVQADLFYPATAASAANAQAARRRWGIPSGRPVVFNPRNFRPSYVCNDTFFESIPLVLAECPTAVFVCVGMAGNPLAEAQKRALASPDCLHLLPSVPRAEMADLFRIADVTVSPSLHDGTPNTLLEGMACGAFPVVGDVESIHEWIRDEVNGLFCDAREKASVATAIVRAIKDPELRERAAQLNRSLISERAEYRKAMGDATSFYERVVNEHASMMRGRAAVVAN